MFHDDDDGEPSVWGDRGALTIEFAGVAPHRARHTGAPVAVRPDRLHLLPRRQRRRRGARAATAAASDGDAEGACRAAATEHLPAKWREESKVNCALSDHVWKADVDLAPPVLFPGADILPFTVSGRAGAAEEG